MNVSLPEEVTAALTAGVARGVETRGYVQNVGDVGRLQQVRAADATLAAAENPGGTAGAMVGAGIGLGLGGQLGQTIAANQALGATPPPLVSAMYHVEVNGAGDRTVQPAATAAGGAGRADHRADAGVEQRHGRLGRGELGGADRAAVRDPAAASPAPAAARSPGTARAAGTVSTPDGPPPIPGAAEAPGAPPAPEPPPVLRRSPPRRPSPVPRRCRRRPSSVTGRRTRSPPCTSRASVAAVSSSSIRPTAACCARAAATSSRSSDPGDRPAERDLLATLEDLRKPAAAQQVTAAPTKELVCPNCNGHIGFVGTLTATRCPFCATPVQRSDIKDAPNRLPVDGVVPFGIDTTSAEDKVKEWINGRWFAPNDFKKYSKAGSFSGVYLPFFTFDAQTYTEYEGERGDNYTVTVGSGQNQRTETRIRWHHVRGAVDVPFDDVAIGAEASLEPDRLRDLEPWPTQAAVAFRAEYLAGSLSRSYEKELDVCHGEAVTPDERGHRLRDPSRHRRRPPAHPPCRTPRGASRPTGTCCCRSSCSS